MPSHRTASKSVRFTDDELVAVRVKLNGRDFSAVTRALLFEANIPEPRRQARPPKIIRRQLSEFEASTVRQLVRIGTNLNQIARRANGGANGLEVLSLLVSIERHIREIAARPSHPCT